MKHSVHSFRALTLVSALTASLLSLAAQADPVPAPVDEMIRAAAAGGDAAALAAVVNTAKKTHPASSAEIDALAKQLASDAAAEHEKKLAQQEWFEGWKGQGEAGASNATGNTTAKSLALGLHFNRLGLRWDHLFDATADYARSTVLANGNYVNATTTNRYFAGYNTRYKFDDSLYATGLLSWENNRIAGFDRRFTESVGMGYSIINKPEFSLALEAGPALRQTDYVNNTSDSTVAARVALHNKWVITTGLTFTEDAAWYGASKDSTLTSDTALTATITGALSARLSFHVQRESNPPTTLDANGNLVQLKTTDTLTRLTLVYSF